MKLLRVATNCMLIVLATAMFAACGPKLVHRPSACEVVKLPEIWRIQDYPDKRMRQLDFRDKFELRRSGSAIVIALKAGLLSYDNIDVFSQQKYRFQLSKPTRLVGIADAEWSIATPMFKPKSVLDTHQDVSADANDGALGYKGRRFVASGRRLIGAYDECCLLSPSKTSIVIQSMDGKQEGWGPFADNSGVFHADIVNLTTGEKRFTLSFYSPNAPASPAQGTHWLSDQYVFLDLFAKKEAFVLCDATQRD